MRNIEFVSYDGENPNLCSGTLIVKVDGEERKVNCKLISGGSIKCNKNWDCIVEQGAWTIEFKDYAFSKKEQKYITKLVNKNVPFGCCGGCI